MISGLRILYLRLSDLTQYYKKSKCLFYFLTGKNRTLLTGSVGKLPANGFFGPAFCTGTVNYFSPVL